jgi:hypothetical protein
VERSVSELLIQNAGDALTLSITPDWPSIMVTGMIGIGSIFTSIAVAWITYSNQRTQNRVKQAELRQEWLSEARATISSIVSLCHVIKVRSKTDKEFLKSSESYTLHQELFVYRSKITLMLDAKKPSTVSLLAILEDLIKSVTTRSVERDDMKSYMYAFEALAGQILEEAWTQIRKDLGTKI